MNYYAIGWLHILNVTIRLLCPNSVVEGPTMFALRKAQLLWPDAKIDTLVSIGCCTVPTKVIVLLKIIHNQFGEYSVLRYTKITKAHSKNVNTLHNILVSILR